MWTGIYGRVSPHRYFINNSIKKRIVEFITIIKSLKKRNILKRIGIKIIENKVMNIVKIKIALNHT